MRNDSRPNDGDVNDWERWLQIVVFYMLVGGVLGSALNLSIGIGIIRCRQLRSRFYIITCFLVLTRTCISLQYLVVGVYRVLRNLELVSVWQSRIVCQKLHFFLYTGSFAEELLLMFLVIERMVGICKPIFYRYLTPRQAAVICVCLELCAVTVRWIPSYISVDLNELVPCLNIYSGLPRFFETEYQYLATAMMLACLCLYLTLICFTLGRVRCIKNSSSNNNSNNTNGIDVERDPAVTSVFSCCKDDERLVGLERQLSLLPLLRNIVFCHIGLALLARLTLTLSTVIPRQTPRCVLYAGIFQSCDMSLGGVVIFWSRREVRDACLSCCRQQPEKKNSCADVAQSLLFDERKTIVSTKL